MDRKELVTNIVSKIKNGVFVEIGTFTGAFADHILSSSEGSTLYCIDPYIHYDGYNGDSTNNEVGDALFNQVVTTMKAKYNERIIFIRAFSNEAIRMIPDEIDFLYIDGNHSYKYVYDDLKNYYPKVKPNCFIVGDDAVDLDETNRNKDGDVFVQWPGGAFGCYGVIKAFNEFVANKNISGKVIGNQYLIQKPICKNITLVTGFYDINRSSWENSARDINHYVESFKEYLKLNYKIVVFIDDRIDMSWLSKPTITVVPINMDWLKTNTEAWKQLDTAKRITESSEYINLTKQRRTDGQPQNIHPEYCVINHSKIDFIKYAIDHDLIEYNDFICWSDFGYHNSILHMNPAEFPTKELDSKRFNLDKLCFFLRNPILESDVDPIQTLTYPRETFTGSLWGGPRHLLLYLHALYQECLNELYSLNISDFDQHIYLRCYLKSPQLFQLYVSDGKWPQALLDLQIV